MVQLLIIVAVVVLAVVYFVLLYGGIRVMAAFNLMPKEWFRHEKSPQSKKLTAASTPADALPNSVATFLDFRDRHVIITSSAAICLGKPVLAASSPQSLTRAPIVVSLVQVGFKGEAIGAASNSSKFASTPRCPCANGISRHP